ncbi:MAG: extracellular solute-binding protein [Lachnospiraceae bacterium]|nr:extracellular solute-binding protein [Lachnospiraceae bacterium]
MKRGRIIGIAILILAGIVLYAFAWKSSEKETKATKNRESVTISWFVAKEGYSKDWNPQKNVTDAKILEKTGVNLEITSGDLTELDALMATDNLPDLITVEADAPERAVLENTGMVEPLEPLFAQYAPDVNIPDSMKEWYRNENGNWYSIASYYYGPERVSEEFGGYLGGVHNNNYVRGDLLEKTGVSWQELKTKEGVLKALRAAKKMTYQGESIIPYSGWYTQNIAEQFGMQIEDANGNFLSMYRQPEWLEALLFGNQLYREGLMLPEEFTESINQRMTQVQMGKIFFCTGYSNVKDAGNYLSNRDAEAYIEYAGHIRGDAGNPPNLESVSSGGWTTTMISKDAKNVDRIVEFIAYMTSEEGTLDAAPNIGARTYDIIDGQCVMKEDVAAEFNENYAAAAEKYYLNLEFFVDWTIVQKYQPPEDRINYLEQYKGCTIYDSKAADAAVVIDGNRAMSEMKKTIDAYYAKAEVEILISNSAEECIKKYEETIAEMDRLGLRQLEAFEKERYQKAKERLP